MRPFWTIFAGLFFGAATALMGQTVTPDVTFTPTPSPLRPIQMKWEPLFGTVYYQEEGKYIFDYSEIHPMIDPLHDYEASLWLRKSQGDADKAGIFRWVGLLAAGTGILGLSTGPSDQQDLFWGISIGGALSWSLGGLLTNDSKGELFNAVQRYNRFARGEEQVLPKPQEDEKSLMNMDFLKPSPTPGTNNK